MSVHFKSIRSGSSGNCLMLWSKKTRILFDCGFRTQKGCRCALDEDVCGTGGIDAVVVSHTHGDHIHTMALHVLGEREIPVMIHEDSLGAVQRKYLAGRSTVPELKTFDGRSMQVGEFCIRPFGVSHWEDMDTFGFSVTFDTPGGERRLVIATDFYDADEVLDEFIDADFIYVEANHDLQLLRKNPNPNSRYHLRNTDTGRLLAEVLKRSATPPGAIMLGHLSNERNTPEIALATVRRILEKSGIAEPPPLYTAPRNSPSDAMRIG